MFKSILVVAIFTTASVYAQETSRQVIWSVPFNVESITIRSWSKTGDELFNYVLPVLPGQKFQLDAR